MSVGLAAGEQHWSVQKNWTVSEEKANCVCICVCSAALWVRSERRCVCVSVFVCVHCKPRHRGWFHSKYDWFPCKYLPNIFLFPSKIDLFDCRDCSKDLMENKFESIWNSWVDSLGLPSVSPCLFVFRRQEGSRLCWLRRYLVCLLLQTSWRGSYCRWSEIGQTWSSCVILFPQKVEKIFLSSCQVICFIICYCGIASFMALFFKIIIFTKPERNKCFTSRRAAGSATCPSWPRAAGVRLVVSGWGMHIIPEWIGQALTAEKRAWCSVE